MTRLLYAAAILAASVSTATGCSTPGKSTGKPIAGNVVPATAPVEAITTTDGGGSVSAMMPKALIYRTNGQFADNVPVTLTADRHGLLSYPAPSDLRGGRPVYISDGYYLDRRGIGPNTAFTRYTYAEYEALHSAPSARELMDAIIPGAEITEIVQLPMTAAEAAADTAAVKSLITRHLPGCRRLLDRRAVLITPEK